MQNKQYQKAVEITEFSMDKYYALMWNLNI